MVPATAAVPQSMIVEARADAAVPSLWVEVLSGPANLEPEAIRAAVERELGLSTHADSGRPYAGKVTIEGLAGPAVSIRYESEDATTKLERRVMLPVDPTRRSLVVSWVVGNLVRNEAAEILAGIARRPLADATNETAPVDAQNYAEGVEPAAGPPPSAAAPAPKPQPSQPQAATSPPSVSADSPAAAADLGPARVINLSLYSPGVALHSDAAQRRYYVSFGGVYSHIRALDGFALTWFVDHVEKRTRGALISGIWSQTNDSVGFMLAGIGTKANANLVGAEMSGLVTLRHGCVMGAQLTGLWATAGSTCKSFDGNPDGMALLGLQMAGLVTHVGSGFRGVQVAGASTIASKRYEGLQIAGGVAYAKGGYSGGQLGMVGSVSAGRMSGIQLSGGVNYHVGDATGLQLTGGLNRADDVRGMQLGFVNWGRDIYGLQLGIVNVARENHGLALGLLNWSERARLQPTYFFQTPGLHSIGYRSISGHSLGAISFGYDPLRDIARTHFAVGARAELNRFATGLELGYGWVLESFSSGPSDRAHELDLIGTVTLEVVRNALSIFGGGGVAVPVAGLVAIEPRGLFQAGISFF